MNDILIVAAEASSSLYAKRLLEYWKAEGIPVRAFGIGSRDMEALGFECLGRSEDLAVVGLQEVIAHFSEIKDVFYKLIEEAKKRKPKAVLLLDYPDFNLRLAKKLKALGIPVVYYISPQVWAWRQSRVHTIKARVDKMLVLFPFEKDFYQQHGVDVEFVGHPLLDEIDGKYFDEKNIAFKRARYGIQEGEKLLALMPGSRKSELNHHLDVQLATASELLKTHPNLKVALFVAPTISMEAMRARLTNLKIPVMLIQDEPFEMIQLADVVLCASGTATLMVGLLQKPMVIMYRMNPFTAMMAKMFVRATKFFGLINLVLDREAVKEYFQEKASIANLTAEISRLLNDSIAYKQTVQDLSAAHQNLGEKGATKRVAKALQPYLEL